MNNNEILNKYIDLIDKGYCCACNELNCIDNFPQAKITHAIRKLQQENKRLKDNWNKLKEHLKNRYDNGTESISYRQVFMEIREAMQVLEIAQELEGSDSNE